MAVTIREFDGTDADYRAFADIRNAVMRAVARTPTSWRQWDETLQRAGRTKRRFLVMDDGTPVGYGQWGEMLLFPGPGRTGIEGALLPSHRGRGLGRRLFDHVLEHGRQSGFYEWVAMISEELDAGCRFLERRGFVERDREIELWMDLSQPTTKDLETRMAALRERGITIDTLESLKAGYPDWKDRLYDTSMATVHDIPVLFELEVPDRETFRRTDIDVEGTRHDALFVARHGDDWIGFSELRVTEAGTPEVHQEYTTVSHGWRRIGLAHALKLRGFEWARTHGFPTIRTMCLASNKAMIALNEKLGFRKGSAWILFVRNDSPAKE